MSSDADSDDGCIMMRRSTSKKVLPPLHRKKRKNPFSATGKTIAMLPSTILKDRDNVSVVGISDSVPLKTGFWDGTKLSPSHSQETLRPSKPSTRILLGDDEDDDDMDWQPPNDFMFINRKANMQLKQDRYTGESSISHMNRQY
jgi:hypothetical protein